MITAAGAAAAGRPTSWPPLPQVGLSPPARPSVLKGVDAGFLWPWLVGGAKLGNEVQAELRLAADADAVPDATGRSLLYQWQVRGSSALFGSRGRAARTFVLGSWCTTHACSRRLLCSPSVGPSQTHRMCLCSPTPQDAANEDRRLSPLNVRPVTPREPCPYLAHPSFSSCTVPVVWTPVWTVKLRPRIPRSAGDAFGGPACCVTGCCLWAMGSRQRRRLSQPRAAALPC